MNYIDAAETLILIICGVTHFNIFISAHIFTILCAIFLICQFLSFTRFFYVYEFLSLCSRQKYNCFTHKYV